MFPSTNKPVLRMKSRESGIKAHVIGAAANKLAYQTVFCHRSSGEIRLCSVAIINTAQVTPCYRQ